MVLDRINRIDPSGTGSSETWFAEEESRYLSGFESLQIRWIEAGHRHGADQIFKRWQQADPTISRKAILTHLHWLRDQGSKREVADLFKTGLIHEIEASQSTPEDFVTPLLNFAAQDRELSLIAWTEFYLAGNSTLLPERIKTKALDRSNFGDTVSFKQILQVTGLLEPVTSFTVELSTVQLEGRRSSWIEELYNSLSNVEIPEFQKARDALNFMYPDGANFETPGIHILLLLLNSPTQDRPGLLPRARVEPAINIFDRMPTDSKAAFAALIDALIPAYGESRLLRDWVWTHHQAAWETQGAAFQNLVGPGDFGTWHSPEFLTWIRGAMKYGQTEHATDVIRQIRSLHLIQKTTKVPTGETISDSDHPFSLTAALSTLAPEEGTDYLPGTFDLLLALGKDPTTPPGRSFPSLKTMVYGDRAEITFQPTDEASAGQFHDWVTGLGERYVDDPVRFLIVPSFRGLHTVGKPATLAELQRLAAEEKSPGGWLAKDLAELLPRWFIRNRKDHEALIAAGGHCHSFNRVETYLRDQRAPVASRVSYALGILDWNAAALSANTASRIGAPLPYFPEIGELASEFSNEYDASRSLTSNVSLETWRMIIGDWMLDPAHTVSEGNVSALRSARAGFISRFEGLLDQRLAIVPNSIAMEEHDLNSLTPLLGLYANLLRLDDRNEDLNRLWKQIEGRVRRPKQVFTWVDFDIRDPRFVAGRLISENQELALRYRTKGWESVMEALVSTDHAQAILALSETTAQLEFSEWIQFCQKSLDFANSGNGPAHGFFTLPPAPFLKSSRNLSPELKRQHLSNALKGVEIADEHVPFFMVALPPVFHHYVRNREEASYLASSLLDGGSRNLNQVMVAALTTEADRMFDLPDTMQILDHLTEQRIPLAQRWITASYFLLPIRTAEHGLPPGGGAPDIMSKQRTAFSETGLVLLAEALDAGLPVWELPQRALGGRTYPIHPVVKFISLYSFQLKSKKSIRLEPGHAMLDERRIDGVMLDSSDKRSLLSSLHEIALLLDDHETASYLFVLAEKDLNFETQVDWLTRWNDPKAIARLFREKWRLSDGLNTSRFFTISEEDTRSILREISDDPDLLLLARSFISPRPFLSSALCGEIIPQSHGTTTVASHPGEAILVSQFIAHTFKNPEMERLCLGHLPVRPSQALLLAPWLERRLEEHEFHDLIKGTSRDFHMMWPYWSRQIQALAAAGNFDELATMIPEANWFKGARGGNSSRYDDHKGSTVEETVWVGFAVALGHSLAIHNPHSHPALGDMVARLIANPPVSRGPDAPGRNSLSSQANEPWVFRRLSLESLSNRAVANLLVTTLDEPEEKVLAETRRFLLPPGPIYTGGATILPLRFQKLFLAVADYSTSLNEERRQRLFLRACDASNFSEHGSFRDLPFSHLIDFVLPDSVTKAELTLAARARLAKDPESPTRAADLGLVLLRLGSTEEGEKLLMKAAPNLSEPENLSSFRKVDQALVNLRARKTGPR